ERYDAVIPGYHMNKKHWNTVLLDNSVGDNLIYEWIDDSYNLVTEKLNKTNKEKLKNL
ncbi:MAG: MmcQ/YjbR family DNA-binding protein, partial [Bacteroidetes bacterium]|nr:MmcQ/YjbR family DNA-binding protein [Bacteroidota bacterium]